MFTGIIEEIASVIAIEKGGVSSRLTISGKRILSDIKLGDSIAVNGVCLTAARFTKDSFTADVMAETMRRTNLGSLTPGSRVNLERAMAADGRFGGHIVTGHIDGTGKILSMEREENAVWVKIGADPQIMNFIVEKGSIAIDGISLTVAAVSNENFQVSIIPHTGQETTLLRRSPGQMVNLENDIIGKYVEKLLQTAGVERLQRNKSSQSRQNTTSKIDLNFLSKHGF